MLASEMIFEIARDMGLDDTGNDGSSVASDEFTLMLRWLNRGVVDVLKKTKCYTDLGSMTLTAGSTDYRTDSNVLAVKNITIPDSAGNPIELNVVNMETLLPYLSSLVATTASPMYAAVEGTLLRVAPAPTSAVVLTYVYVPRPTKVTQSTVTSADMTSATYGGIAEEYSDAVMAFMKWKAAEYDQQGGGFYRGHAFAPGSAFEAVYEKEIVEVKKGVRAMGQRGLSPGKVGYPDRGRYPTRNDTYPSYDR